MNRPKKTKKIFVDFLKYFIPYKFHCLALFIVILLGLTASVLQPVLWSKVITALVKQKLHDLIAILVMMVSVYLVMVTTKFSQSIVTSYLNKQVIYDMQNLYFHKMLSMNMSYFDKTQNGIFIARIVTDITQSVDIITNQIVPALINLCKLTIILVIMMRINLLLTAITVFLMPITLWLYSINIKKMREKQVELKQSNDSVVSMIQQAVAGIKNIKGLGLKEIETELFLEQNKIKTKKAYGFALFVIGFQTLLSVIGMLGEISVYVVGAYLTVIAALSIEKFIQFVSYSQQFGNSSLSLINLVSDYQRIIVNLLRLQDIGDNGNAYHEQFGVQEILYEGGDIELKNVSYGYSDKLILKDINLEIVKGQITAIVGESGSGKSTLINLMMRLYKENNGTIKLNGIDIKNLTEKSIRDYISVVSQQHFLFNASIWDNFRYINPDITLEEIKDICEQCEMDEIIEKLPEQYETIIYENGTNFSMGQLQRLSIARVLAKNTPVILFDEPTSALDRKAANKIRKLIEKLKRDKTIVIISHDFEFIQCADIIYKIEKHNLIQV
uniref:ABC transporter ATP-binding protein n=1 Tax=Eubacterium plexicaudatum ASF492 TaxID=1235802 RepID=N2ANB9_9FIRM